MSLTPGQRILRARMGGLATAANGTVNTVAAREAFLAKFEAQVDPDRLLSAAERQRRALAARRAYMTRLAFKSSRTRSRKARDAGA